MARSRSRSCANSTPGQTPSLPPMNDVSQLNDRKIDARTQLLVQHINSPTPGVIQKPRTVASKFSKASQDHGLVRAYYAMAYPHLKASFRKNQVEDLDRKMEDLDDFKKWTLEAMEDVTLYDLNKACRDNATSYYELSQKVKALVFTASETADLDRVQEQCRNIRYKHEDDDNSSVYPDDDDDVFRMNESVAKDPVANAELRRLLCQVQFAYVREKNLLEAECPGRLDGDIHTLLKNVLKLGDNDSVSSFHETALRKRSQSDIPERPSSAASDRSNATTIPSNPNN